ncbi:MAG TPA: BlaI/MecI/CopY family transcriptional regulator [Candidatus Acidoferrum sp.]|nr:BlaI/MecI/CopY family transcriptional regulator [Candidatus Acidoferrum sp.]
MNPELKLSNADYRLLMVVWDAEPVASPELCKLAQSQLGWKRTTTYTVLKRLCDRELLKNENTVVTSLVGRKEVQRAESREVVNRSFDGSLPQFIAAFLGEQVSDDEAEQIARMIDAYRGRK